MTPKERKQLWLQRIEAYKASGETNVKTWCHHNQIGTQSMYKWMKRLASEPEPNIDLQPTTQWMELTQSSSPIETNSSLCIQIGKASIEIQENFNRTLLEEVLEILQHHVE